MHLDEATLSQAIARVLACELGNEDASGWRLTGRLFPGELEPLSRESVGRVARLVNDRSFKEPATLVSSREFEQLLIERGSPLFSRLRLRGPNSNSVEFSDTESGFAYAVGPASAAMIASLIVRLEGHVDLVRVSFLARGRGRDEAVRDPWELLNSAFRRFVTLRITSDADTTHEKFARASVATLYQFAHGLNWALAGAPSPAQLFPETERAGRRLKTDELEAPKLRYESDLVERYVAAVGSDEVVSKYIGFYQILEHYFEALYNRFVVEQVRAVLTNPTFSLRRDVEVNKLVKKVTGLIRERDNETAAFNEQRALKLTLEEYVDVSRLRDSVLALGGVNAVEFYARNEVDFCGGDGVDLNGSRTDVIQQLTIRVYKTRNAVVHAKLGEKARYRPDADQGTLVKELPLLRALAEEVLLSSAKLL